MKLLATLRSHTDEVTQVSFECLYVHNQLMCVCVLMCRGMQSQSSFIYTCINWYVSQVCWNPCNQKWVTGSDDSTICIWVSESFISLPLLPLISKHLLSSLLTLYVSHAQADIMNRFLEGYANNCIDICPLSLSFLHNRSVGMYLLVP